MRESHRSSNQTRVSQNAHAQILRIQHDNVHSFANFFDHDLNIGKRWRILNSIVKQTSNCFSYSDAVTVNIYWVIGIVMENANPISLISAEGSIVLKTPNTKDLKSKYSRTPTNSR